MSNEKKMQWVAYFFLLVITLGFGYLQISVPPLPPMPVDEGGGFGAQGVVGGISNFTGLDVAAPTVFTTATPAVLINSLGLGNILEIRDASTPVFTINNGGGVVQTGDTTYSGGTTFNNWVLEAGPTALPTGTPGFVADNAGVSQVASFRDGGTELLGVRNGGGVIVAAATAVATGQPALQVDSSGGLSNIFEIRDSATPVFAVEDGGSVTGLVVRYASAGQQMVVGTSSGVTETVVAAHGLTTVTFALCTLGEDVDTDAGDPVVCTAAVSANVVTLSLWEDDWSAAGTAAEVHWLVIGTP